MPRGQAPQRGPDAQVRRIRPRRNAQDADHQALRASELAFELLGDREQFAAARQVTLAVRGGLDPLRSPVEEPDTQRSLEPGHAARQCRLAQPEGLGRPCEVAMPGERLRVMDEFQVEHDAQILSNDAFGVIATASNR